MLLSKNPIVRACRVVVAVSCSQLLAMHRTAVLRHDDYGQETLLNLLLRNYLFYNLYDQVVIEIGSRPGIAYAPVASLCSAQR